MDNAVYRQKVMGCWLGKVVGGTLGQPYEGTVGNLDLKFYDPVPTDMIPNDDLDLQVLWAWTLAQMEHPVIDRDVFADAWLKHVKFPWDEYGLAIRNLHYGIKPPLSGSYDNFFVDGLGAAIRSEIWACMAPGNPALAARYAYEDACVDHSGDGLYAEIFLAAAESAAFCENDVNRVIDAGLAQIPADCRLAQAITITRTWCSESSDWKAIHPKIMERFGSDNFTDVVMNLPFMVMALILGKGDFSRSICLAVNCAMDADCTGASVGAILGILNPDGINSEWLRPIGRKLVINDGIVGITPPPTIDEFSELVMQLKDKVTLRKDKPAPTLPKLELEAQCGLCHNWLKLDDRKFPAKMPPVTEKRTFPGCNGSIPAAEVPFNSIYLMNFRLHLDQAQKVRIMCNSASNARVWVDGQFLFGREGGRLAPSFHRVPINQFGDIELAAGDHELRVGIGRMGNEENLSWTIGVGNPVDGQWLPFALNLRPAGK